MLKHLLVAYDGSEQATKAFDFALEIATKFQSEITVLAVVRLPEPADDVETEALIADARTRYHKLFDHLRTRTQNFTPLKLEFKVVVGHPAEQIVDQSEAMGVDHIIMGHRGKAIFKRWLLGSVAKQVMIYAHCGITIIR